MEAGTRRRHCHTKAEHQAAKFRLITYQALQTNKEFIQQLVKRAQKEKGGKEKTQTEKIQLKEVNRRRNELEDIVNMMDTIISHPEDHVNQTLKSSFTYKTKTYQGVGTLLQVLKQTIRQVKAYRTVVKMKQDKVTSDTDLCSFKDQQHIHAIVRGVSIAVKMEMRQGGSVTPLREAKRRIVVSRTMDGPEDAPEKGRHLNRTPANHCLKQTDVPLSSVPEYTSQSKEGNCSDSILHPSESGHTVMSPPQLVGKTSAQHPIKDVCPCLTSDALYNASVLSLPDYYAQQRITTCSPQYRSTEETLDTSKRAAFCFSHCPSNCNHAIYKNTYRASEELIEAALAPEGGVPVCNNPRLRNAVPGVKLHVATEIANKKPFSSIIWNDIDFTSVQTNNTKRCEIVPAVLKNVAVHDKQRYGRVSFDFRNRDIQKTAALRVGNSLKRRCSWKFSDTVPIASRAGNHEKIGQLDPDSITYPDQRDRIYEKTVRVDAECSIGINEAAYEKDAPLEHDEIFPEDGTIRKSEDDTFSFLETIVAQRPARSEVEKGPIKKTQELPQFYIADGKSKGDQKDRIPDRSHGGRVKKDDKERAALRNRELALGSGEATAAFPRLDIETLTIKEERKTKERGRVVCLNTRKAANSDKEKQLPIGNSIAKLPVGFISKERTIPLGSNQLAGGEKTASSKPPKENNATHKKSRLMNAKQVTSIMKSETRSKGMKNQISIWDRLLTSFALWTNPRRTSSGRNRATGAIF